MKIKINRCPRCNQPVYAAEERTVESFKFHKLCLKCVECNKSLEPTTLSIHRKEDGSIDILCKQCYGRKHGTKGYGFGVGAGSLNMDTGKSS